VLHAATTARLVLLDPLLEVPAHEFAAVRADQLAELELTLELLRTEKPHWHPRDLDTKIEAVAQADRTMVERTFDDNPHWNVVDDAKRLAVPTLILGADHAVYSMLPTETADAIVTANPHVTYRVVKGSGHSPHRDRPDETIAAIREWVLPATVH
jgi:pimeloyl-ACP methyl ester carboxylesterase